jgi:hypothetical protein
MSDTQKMPRPVTRLLRFAGLLSLVACGQDLSLPPAQLPVTQQQITLSAVTNTPVNTNSAYNMVGLAEVRTDLSNNFDFVFDLGPDSSYGLGTTGDTIAVLMPRGYVGFVQDGGMQFTLTSFDSVVIAPALGYETQKPTRIRGGDVILAASRLQTCDFGILSPRYAKMDIVSIDVPSRTAIILVKINPNCGYRSLKDGIPPL